ncbi:MAG TPA: alkaline phosphatase D family protein [Allosphingosinicella sp.]|nr:alkaline phosphatase D family protein [Allosphingosinicella sp.]
MTLNRRQFVQLAAAMGASLAWGGPIQASTLRWRERRDLYPEGVASGDPAHNSVILWTRRPFDSGDTHQLNVEIAEDEAFRRVIATARATVSAASDWTCRVLVGRLRPARVYWYRFTDAEGNGSRIGRTITAPAVNDRRPVNFAFVSCQNINEGFQHAYRRMIFEDERAPRAEQLGFVLHLGDFIYEVVQYREDIQTRFDRTIVDIGPIPDSVKFGNFHVPTTVEGYRAIYRAYLHDRDIQDARARWPFVAIWDNHEFSWQGWQSVMKGGGYERPGQSVKVAANQAWFEYQPARITKPSGPGLDRFDPPAVMDAPLTDLDENGLSHEPNNLAAINSLTVYRTLRYGAHLDLMITDQYSYKMLHPFNLPEGESLGSPPRPLSSFYPEEVGQILDAGRTYNGGNPPDTITVGETTTPNYRKDKAPYTILGERQKRWFLDQLRQSRATWKVWGNSLCVLENRADPQNLPDGLTERWPGAGYSNVAVDYSGAFTERGEIYDLVRDAGITGFAIVSGDRHSFWAGYAAKSLPPKAFEPVGLSFVTGSISSPGQVEALENSFPREHVLRPLFMADRPGSERPQAAVNMLMRHGVRSCLEYARSGDLAAARAVRNPDLSPHLEFVDMGGHGYATVRLSAGEMTTEFVCIPRPSRATDRPDGGPLRYRVVHSAPLWRAGERPRLVQRVVEGDPGLSI